MIGLELIFGRDQNPVPNPLYPLRGAFAAFVLTFYGLVEMHQCPRKERTLKHFHFLDVANDWCAEAFLIGPS